MAKRLDVHHGDMRDVLPQLAAEGQRFHAVVTDPPYHLGPIQGRPSRAPEGMYATMRSGFMGKAWDGGRVAFEPETWRAVFDVLHPGGHMFVFGGTRTEHRMTCAIEDAGFEIRDKYLWLYGSGFPKSLDVSKAIDAHLGAKRQVVGVREYAGGHIQNSSADKLAPPIGTFVRTQDDRLDTAPATPEAQRWAGWGTAAKPAYEPICLARKPLGERTVAANVLRYGTGGLNVDACRIGTTKDVPASPRGPQDRIYGSYGAQTGDESGHNPNIGRWPANLLHDGSPEVEAAFAAFGESKSTASVRHNSYANGNSLHDGKPKDVYSGHADTGSASRFFYSSKADKGDRADSRHPTIKPVDLMRWLCQLICPPGGHILDPFAGSGTTGEAAMLLGMDCTMIDADAQHVADIRHRIRRWSGLDAPLFAEAAN